MPLEGEYADPPQNWVGDQLAAIDEAGDTRAVDIVDSPVVVLTIRGAKTGKLRRVPLMRVEHGGCYAAVASKGGAPDHPVWYANITANPQIELQDGAERYDLVAREVTGAERDEWWARCVAAFQPYAQYQENTDRQIPVLVCCPQH